jgi:putative peptidoglycan lipid II flippase
MFLLRGFRLALGILNLTISAKYFGITQERDAWLLALNSIVVFDMAIWGPINETFRARFLFIKEEEGERMHWRRQGVFSCSPILSRYFWWL